jgi:hypothetical protein
MAAAAEAVLCLQKLATGCLLWVRTVLKGEYQCRRPEKLPKRAPKVGIFALRARFRQLFGPALRVTVATIHTGTVSGRDRDSGRLRPVESSDCPRPKALKLQALNKALTIFGQKFHPWPSLGASREYHFIFPIFSSPSTRAIVRRGRETVCTQAVCTGHGRGS